MADKLPVQRMIYLATNSDPGQSDTKGGGRFAGEVCRKFNDSFFLNRTCIIGLVMIHNRTGQNIIS